MGGCEEGGFDVVFVVEFEESVDTDGGAEDAAGDVGWILRRAVAGVYPVCYGVDVDW